MPGADTMRSDRTEPSALPHRAWSASASPVAFLAVARLALAQSRLLTSIFLPPFPRDGFASRPSRRSQIKRPRYYEGSDSCRPHPGQQVSPLTPLCLPNIQPPTTRRTPNIAFSVTSAVRSEPTVGPSASPIPRGLADTPRRNGFVILQAVRSPPVALHPASRRRSYFQLHAA